MDNTMPYVIALYIRLSTEDSKTGSMSIDSQRQLLHQYADSMASEKNTEIQEFVDNGFSGTNFERPAVQKLLELVRNGQIHCIIVKDFTRFGRNSIEVGYFMERVFPLYRVRFISVNDHFDSNTLHGDTGGINIAFKYLVSEFYSRDLSIKIRSARSIKLKRGEYQSKNCLYGYRKGANGRLELNEDTAPNVRLVYELAKEGHRPADIIRILFERKIPTPSEYRTAHGIKGVDSSRCDGIWGYSMIIRILSDERYTGTYIAGKSECIEIGSRKERMRDESEWIKIPNHHPAIVSKELFDLVQSKRRHINYSRKNVHMFPLRSKIFCGCCHHALSRLSCKSRFFYCEHTKVNADAPCHGLKIMEGELETAVFDVLSRQALIILNLDDLSGANLLKIQIEKISEYNNQVENCHEQKRVLYEQFLMKEIELKEYKMKKAAVDVELERLQKAQSLATAQATQMQMDEKTRKARLKLAREVTKSSGLTSELVDALIERIYVYPGNQIEIVWKMKDFCVEEP